MDEISQGPRDDRRSYPRPPRPKRWLAVVTIASVVVVGTVLAVTRGGSHRAAAPRPPVAASHGSRPAAAAGPVQAGELGPRIVVPQVSQATAASGPRPTAVPGTLLLTCDAVLWGQLPPDWRAGSLRVGPLWLVGGRQLGYAHLGRTAPATRTPPVRVTARHVVEMLVHVDAGATVAIRAAPGAPPGFRFTEAGLDSADMPRVAERGFTLASCPRGAIKSPIWTDFYDLGFSVIPGQPATVEVWTSASARPVSVTLD